MTYEHRRTDGVLHECESCGYPAPLATVEMHTGHGPEPQAAELCEVCASTFIANASVFYPAQYENGKLYASMGWIANKILDSLKGTP